MVSHVAVPAEAALTRAKEMLQHTLVRASWGPGQQGPLEGFHGQSLVVGGTSGPHTKGAQVAGFA